MRILQGTGSTASGWKLNAYSVKTQLVESGYSVIYVKRESIKTNDWQIVINRECHSYFEAREEAERIFKSIPQDEVGIHQVWIDYKSVTSNKEKLFQKRVKEK